MTITALLRRFAIFVLLLLFLSCGHTNKSKTIDQVFTYHSDTAKRVSVAGTFNNWSLEAHPFTYNGTGTWSVTIPLVPGYYQYKLVVDGDWITDPANDWAINDGGDNFNSILKAGDPPVPKRMSSKRPFPKNRLPEPVLEDDPEWVDLYYAAWEMAWNKIQHGTKKNGFAPSYMDEGFNELIYQWDICFITAFAVYGRDAFPVMPSLDNFYGKQREDGYIQRVYWETDGTLAQAPTADEPMVNPPLFAWIEWRYYTISGDSSRIRRVLPVLVDYYNWTAEHCRSDAGRGLFYTSPLGSGMDNTPRNGVGKAAWIDYSAQQALAASCIANLADVIRDKETSTLFDRRYDDIRSKINSLLWDPETKFYYDLREDGDLSPTKHVGAYWTLLSGVSDNERTSNLIGHLQNPAEFRRPNMVPTLAADQPEYDPKGHYWLGSVWAPTNYMVIRGLMRQGYRDLADSISLAYLGLLNNVYLNFKPEPEKVAFEERYADDYHTLWECYSSEMDKPATRWDNTFYSRQDFVGWTGLGPIALLIENILGFDIQGNKNRIEWTIKRHDMHGIKNIRLGDQKVSLIYRDGTLHITSEKPFRLLVDHDGFQEEYFITNKDTLLDLPN